ncbi:MAG TPA: hypothetical protein VFH63_04680 [candidate division Zixibacteria bacterium]|nr:hypothetical protein [candidate division Zixibacteria bacterium]
MTRPVRIFLAAAILVLLVVTSASGAPNHRGQERRASVAASHQPVTPQDQPEAEDADEGPSAEKLEALAEELGSTPEQISALAETYGLGGAVRILAWAQASGMEPSDIAAMFDDGMGWGQIAQQLNAENPDLDVHPGIGTVMGQGAGHGRANAPGQQKQQPAQP